MILIAYEGRRVLMGATAAMPKAGGFEPHPVSWRVLVGFFVAPLVPAFIYAFSLALLASSIFDTTILVFLVPAAIWGYVTAILLGIPAYFLLRDRLRAGLGNVMAVGGFIAAVPAVVSLTPLLVAQALVLGSIGGAVFWLIVFRPDGRPRFDGPSEG